MRILTLCLLLVLLINLSACSSMRGNVVPQSGPGMEQIYDSMGIENLSHEINDPTDNNAANLISLRQLRRGEIASTAYSKSILPNLVQSNAIQHEFRQLPNPQLKVYVFPHFAGNEQVPIPGYYTAFNVYEQDHYALSNE